MDSTEIHYIDYDPEEIWAEMMVAYVEAGGDILYPGDEKEMLLRSVQAIITQMFSGVDVALRMGTLRYATGEYLDLIGEMHGCIRNPAKPAMFTVDIVTNITGKETILPMGTEMTYDGSVIYRTKEDVILNGNEQSTVMAVVESVYAGEQPIIGTFEHMTLVVPDPQVNDIYITSLSDGGNNEESDEDYRERIRIYGFSSVTAGPSQQYENIAKSVDTRILDAKAINGGAGEVEVYLILSSGSISFIAPEVRDRLSAENVRPLTDTVSVQGGDELSYTLNIQYTKSSASIASEILKAKEEYQSWQDNKFGRAFNPDRLISAIYQAGATRVIISEDSEFNEGAAEYTEIEQYEYCRGTITLEVIE